MNNPGSYLPKDEIKKIIELYDTRPYGIHAIAKKTGHSTGVVRKYLKEAKRI